MRVNKTMRKVGFRKADIPVGGGLKGIGKIKPLGKIKVPTKPNMKVPKWMKV